MFVRSSGCFLLLSDFLDLHLRLRTAASGSLRWLWSFFLRTLLGLLGFLRLLAARLQLLLNTNCSLELAFGHRQRHLDWRGAGADFQRKLRHLRRWSHRFRRWASRRRATPVRVRPPPGILSATFIHIPLISQKREVIIIGLDLKTTSAATERLQACCPCQRKFPSSCQNVNVRGTAGIYI